MALGVVEVSRNGNDRLVNLLAELSFCRFLHFLQNEGRDLLGRILFAVALDPGVAGRTFDDLIGRQLLIFDDIGIVEAATD